MARDMVDYVLVRALILIAASAALFAAAAGATAIFRFPK
jgi:hypothetical protein